MTLQEAIQKVLEENNGLPLSLDRIAELINTGGFYHRKDSSPVPSYQIKLRALNYPQLFRRDGDFIYLVEEQKPDYLQKKELRNKILELQDVIRARFLFKQMNVKLLVLSILLYSRRTKTKHFIFTDPFDTKDYFLQS